MWNQEKRSNFLKRRLLSKFIACFTLICISGMRGSEPGESGREYFQMKDMGTKENECNVGVQLRGRGQQGASSLRALKAILKI